MITITAEELPLVEEEIRRRTCGCGTIGVERALKIARHRLAHGCDEWEDSCAMRYQAIYG